MAENKKPRPEGYVDPRRARGLERVLKLLEEGPMTIREISQRLSVSRAAVRNCLIVLQAAPRKVHVCEWRRTIGREIRVYKLGDCEDVAFVPLHAVRKGKSNPAEMNCNVIVAALTVPMSSSELAESLHCSMTFARLYLAKLLKESPRRIYIAEWRRPNGQGSLMRVFAAGNQKDKKRPTLSTVERFRELKADREKYARTLLLRRLAAQRRRLRKAPQNPFSALGIQLGKAA